MDGRSDFFFFSVWRGYISEVTCHRRLPKKTHPNLTAQVENIGGKINYRATFTCYITRQDQDGERSGLRKNAVHLYRSLPAVGICLPTEDGFFFRVKRLLCYIHLACGIEKAV